MKILFVCQYFYPEQFSINSVCSELAKCGHEVTVLTGLPNYPGGKVPAEYKLLRKRKEFINGVNVIRTSLIGRGKGNFRLALNYISFAVSASLKALFIRKSFDVILIYQLSPVTMAIPGVLLKKITKKPLFLYCLDLWPESLCAGGVSSDSPIYGFLLKITIWIYSKLDRVFISSYQFSEYLRDILGYKKDIVYMPVYADPLFENIGDKDDGNVDFVYAGNVGEMQSVETIIYAANEIKENKKIYIHIVGDGSSRIACESLANKLELKNVIFHGQHPISEMPVFYEMADAFLVTMKDNRIISYTLPYKVQSYMAAGKPIIGAINGEAARVIREAECGLCTPAGDYIQLAESMLTFAGNKADYADCGNNARKFYLQNFTLSRFLDKLNEQLQNL